jgi:hypothetical protein
VPHFDPSEAVRVGAKQDKKSAKEELFVRRHFWYHLPEKADLV